MLALDYWLFSGNVFSGNASKVGYSYNRSTLLNVQAWVYLDNRNQVKRLRSGSVRLSAAQCGSVWLSAFVEWLLVPCGRSLYQDGDALDVGDVFEAGNNCTWDC